MKVIFDNKQFQPITTFTAMLICVHLLKGIKIYTIVLLLIIFVSAGSMCKNLYDTNEYRIRNFIIEFFYIVCIYLTIKYMPAYIRGFYSTVLVILEYSIYVLYINPKFMNRTLVYRIM